MEPKIRNRGFADRGMPSAVAQFPADRLPAKSKAVLPMLSALSFQNGDRITIQRDASRRSILVRLSQAV
jgi:hypothetical protein